MPNSAHDYGTIPCNAIGYDRSTVPDDYSYEGESPVRESEDACSTLPLLQICTIILSLSGVAFATTASTGLLTVCLPAIALDLSLPERLLLWPSSAYSLACGCCLLLAGSIADKIGDKFINLLGTITLAISVLATGHARDGVELIVLRVIQGLGAAMSLPTGVSIIARSLPAGQRRNIGFACLGIAQPLGYSLGLVMGGTVQAAGNWRLGYYACAAILAAFVTTAWVSIPPNDSRPIRSTIPGLVTEIDWVGVLLLSTGFGLLSYTCSILTRNATLLLPIETITAMVAALGLIMASPRWMRRQARLGRPALIPNSIWSNRAFSAITLTVFLAWASLQSSELLASLFFQRVQLVSPFEASIKLLPNVLTGLVINTVTGLTVQHFSIYKLMVSASVVATVSPLIMAVINPAWPYWVAACWAVALAPVSIDVLFTIAHIIVTDVFPANMHALAGGVFNTVSQLGTSLGLSLVAIVSNTATNASEFADKESPEALMVGYRAAFWTCAVMMLLSAGVSLGLSELGRLGSAGHTRSASR